MNNNEKTVKLKYFGLPKLGPYLKPYWKIMLSIVLLGIVTSCVDIVLPLFQKYALDNFVTQSDLTTLVPFVIIYAVTLAVQVTSNVISCYQTGQIEMYVGRDMKKASFDHLQTLSFSYFNQNSVGYIHARVMSDTARLGSTVSWNLMDAVWHLSYIVGAIIVMISINLKLALMVLVVVPITAVSAIFFQKRLLRLNRRVRELNSRITGKFNEGITGAKTAKTLVVEDRMDKDFEELTGDMRRTSLTAGRTRGAFGAVISLASWIALAIVLWRGGMITMEGLIKLGTLSVFMSYALNMMEPIQWLIRVLSELVNVQVNVERFTRLVQTKSDVVDSPEVVEKYGDSFDPKRENWEKLEGDIEFKDVSFMYPDGDEYVLENFSLKVPRGTNVAIVGETGAGKSTLVNLACRFFEPTKGQILIDGRDARERSQLWLHSNIGYVLQTPFLFSGTIRENLLYGKPNATQEDLDAAIDKVSARDIIEKMPKGYDSDVGEGGDLLSTGEKQLLSFARAILADPRIFVLDEATSSIDTVTEKRIQDAIASVLKDRTSFIIAHRLSTIRQSDIILVVKDGKIIEQGTHLELLRAKGYYYRLYTRQYQEEAMEGFDG